MTSRIDHGRRWVTAAIAAGAVTLLPRWPRAAAAAPRVIVIGAGFGGATCARYLKELSPRTNVILIDARRAFYTGPQSNWVIAGLRAPAAIERRLDTIGHVHRVTVLRAAAVDLDPISRTVTLDSGRRLRAERIVVAPGIALRWDAIDGLDAAHSAAMPHAWLGDAQVLTLRERLARVPDGGTVLIGAPANPYRCPPGPYERASLIAHALTATGRGRTKILIADAKDDFSKSALFKLEWDTLYPGMIEWVPRANGGEVVRVDPGTGDVWLRGSPVAVRTDLASIIPPQRAADLAVRADLADESGWCPIDADNFESRRHPGLHIIGDACAGAPMPKSAFAANSQAKLCASAIAAALSGAPPPDARLLNTCYSLVSATEAISVSGLYASNNGKLTVVSEGMSPLNGDVALRQREARQAQDWYDSITADSFGVQAPCCT